MLLLEDVTRLHGSRPQGGGWDSQAPCAHLEHSLLQTLLLGVLTLWLLPQRSLKAGVRDRTELLALGGVDI